MGYAGVMKTTIDLPDSLAAEARAVAHAQRTTLREIMVTALRTEVDRRNAPPTVEFSFPTVGGQGLVVDLDPADVIERSYGLSRVGA